MTMHTLKRVSKRFFFLNYKLEFIYGNDEHHEIRFDRAKEIRRKSFKICLS